MKATVEKVVTLAKDLRRAYRYPRPYVTLLYRGVYGTYAEAERALPSTEKHGFDHDEVVDYFEREQSGWRYLDYPASFWLQSALRTSATVLDLGGGWGQTFYANQKRLTFPENLSWTVCDMEAFTRRGRRLAEERGERALSFVSDLSHANPGDILLTGGTLQYIEDDLSHLLTRLSRKPDHVIAHHMPMYEGEDYYTVQRMSHSYVPYKIMNRARFIERMSAAGYVLRDSWKIPRLLDVMFHPERKVESYFGFYFVRNQSAAS